MLVSFLLLSVHRQQQTSIAMPGLFSLFTVCCSELLSLQLGRRRHCRLTCKRRQIHWIHFFLLLHRSCTIKLSRNLLFSSLSPCSSEPPSRIAMIHAFSCSCIGVDCVEAIILLAKLGREVEEKRKKIARKTQVIIRWCERFSCDG